jgi:hypothetical protein
MVKSVREARFERGNGVAVPTAPKRQRRSREVGKGNHEEEEDDE